MIFTKKAKPKFIPKDKALWKTRFALFPTCVAKDESDGKRTFIWLDFYEVRYYFKEEWQRDVREYRLPGTESVMRTEIVASDVHDF